VLLPHVLREVVGRGGIRLVYGRVNNRVQLDTGKLKRILYAHARQLINLPRILIDAIRGLECPF
jgi:hypothetical protein